MRLQLALTAVAGTFHFAAPELDAVAGDVRAEQERMRHALTCGERVKSSVGVSRQRVLD